MTSGKDDLKSFEALAQSFAEKELAARAAAHDRYPFGDFFGEVVDKAYRAGFLGMMMPEALGGAGAGIGTLCVVLKAISRVDASLAGIVFTQAAVQEILDAAGAGAILEELGRAASVCDFLTAFPAYVDLDVVENFPRAVASGEAFALSGKADLLVLGGMARRVIVPARVGGKGFSFFLMDLADGGVAKSPPVITLGLHTCPAADITFENAPARIIGEEGAGARLFQQIAGKLHLAAGAMNVGIMEGSLAEALRYARERSQGGRALIGWSEIAMILADMSMKTEAAALCLDQACRLLEEDASDARRRSLAAALHIHELACKVVTDGIQVLGGYGYMKDYGQEKRYRDTRQVQALLGSASFKKLSLIGKEAS